MHPIGKPAVNGRDLTGETFGRLTVICKAESKKFPCGSTQAQWLCHCDCGNDCLVLAGNLRQRNTQSCGCLNAESVKRKKGHRNGGSWINRDGYVMMYLNDADARFRRTKTGSYDYEHSIVMGRHLGRPLLSNETVHHKNGDRRDNRLENLELWSFSQPYGQRVVDKLAWAKEIIEQYDPQWRINGNS
jgi:hypothetical protein